MPFPNMTVCLQNRCSLESRLEEEEVLSPTHEKSFFVFSVSLATEVVFKYSTTQVCVSLPHKNPRYCY